MEGRLEVQCPQVPSKILRKSSPEVRHKIRRCTVLLTKCKVKEEEIFREVEPPEPDPMGTECKPTARVWNGKEMLKFMKERASHSKTDLQTKHRRPQFKKLPRSIGRAAVSSFFTSTHPRKEADLSKATESESVCDEKSYKGGRDVEPQVTSILKPKNPKLTL